MRALTTIIKNDFSLIIFLCSRITGKPKVRFMLGLANFALIVSAVKKERYMKIGLSSSTRKA